ncbi:MAG: hypothetical protein LBE91_11910 [Tannerella sp.]|jgi:hypothetical protein|nr:hypothetical protein [Tannerella sp.]
MNIKAIMLEKATRLADNLTIRFSRNRIVAGGRNFSFCKVPVPKGYIQSQTHPSILYFPSKWHGFTHILATTPYPKANIQYENPCLYYADDENSPTVFIPNPDNPIISPPTEINAFNSDPCLCFDNDRIYLINRRCERTPGLREIEIFSSADGTHFSQPQLIITENAGKRELLSPAFIHLTYAKRIYFLNGDAGIGRGGKCRGIDIYEGTSLENPNFAYIQTGQFLNSKETGIEPWHFDLFQFENKLYMVFCGRNNKKGGIRNHMETYLAVSEDFLNFRIFPKPLVSLLKTYRPTAYLDERKVLHLYFSIVGKVANDKSDRSIALTRFDFQLFLEKNLLNDKIRSEFINDENEER